MTSDGAVEGAGHILQDLYGRLEIGILDLQADGARDKLVVESNFNAELARDFAIGARQIAAKIEIARAWLRIEMDFAGDLDARSFGHGGSGRLDRQLALAFGDRRVGWV